MAVGARLPPSGSAAPGAPEPEHLRALRDRLDAVVLAGNELPATLRAIVEEMARDGLRGACIALVNERDELYMVAWQGTVDRAVLDLRLPVGRGVMGTVVSEARAILVDDYDNPPAGLRLPTRGIGSNRLSRSCVAVPIWSDGVVIGVLQLGSREVSAFDVNDVTTLTVVADAISEAVRRAEPGRLANELLQRRVRELTFLQDTAAELRSTLETEGVAARAVVAARIGVGGTRSALIGLDAAGAEVLAADAGEGPLPGSGRRSTAPVPAWVVAALDEGRPVALTAPEWALTWAADAMGQTPPFAIACTPLQSDDRDLVLIVAGEDRAFDPAQCRLLEGVATLVEMALTNAVTYHRLHEAARRDPATGLLTRAAFEGILAARSGGTEPHCILVADIDNVRAVNDSWGHEAGDALIFAVSQAIKAAVDGRAVVSRTGGDEFAVLLHGADSTVGAQLAEEIRTVMHGVQVPHAVPRISVGHAIGDAFEPPARTFNAASRAMRRAKRWGRDRVEAAHTAPVHDDEPQWERLLPEILENQLLRAVLQPIVPLGGGGPIGYEALARPGSTTALAGVGGLFATAQSLGAGRDLDWLCRRVALRDGGAVPRGAQLFVNVGVLALLDPLHDVDQLLLLLRWAGRDPASVVLEITEREAVGDLPRFREVLAAYRQHGIGFAIDDVGEGHSTLEVLAASTPEYVKLAAGLVQSSHERGAAAAVSAVVAFARATGSHVIAEGIETEAQRDSMLELGVDLGQGWLLGRPIEGSALRVDDELLLA